MLARLSKKFNLLFFEGVICNGDPQSCAMHARHVVFNLIKACQNPRSKHERGSSQPICPPPKQSPIAVTNQSVAAVVSPMTISPRLRIAPAPMNPIPERIPGGNRIVSITTNGSLGLPDELISTLL